MLTYNLSRLNFFLIKVFKITNVSFYYINYIFLIYKHFLNIYFNLINANLILKSNSLNRYFYFNFKKIYFNKKTYFNTFLFKNWQELNSSNLSTIANNTNVYMIQKNFTFYYSWHILKNKKFIITFNLKKLLKIFYGFKLLLFNFSFSNIRVMAWSTPEFESETNTTNEYFTIKNLSPLSVFFFQKKKIFSTDVTYNLRIHLFMSTFSKSINRNAVFVSIQDNGHGSFILSRFNYFSIGGLTDLKLKHSYSYLIPINIRTNFAKSFLFSFVLSYRTISHKYQLIFFLLYFLKYKILLKILCFYNSAVEYKAENFGVIGSNPIKSKQNDKKK